MAPDLGARPWRPTIAPDLEAGPMNDTRTRRKDPGTRRGGTVGLAALTALGALLTLGGILLMTVPFHDGTIPQWNALCSSDIGQIGQALDSSAQHDCGMVGVADHVIGWLLGLGILALAGCGLLWLGRARPAP
jgi:hypothetical protein